eukprot:15468720-Alexandrium_andersonii.AAC.1
MPHSAPDSATAQEAVYMLRSFRCSLELLRWGIPMIFTARRDSSASASRNGVERPPARRTKRPSSTMSDRTNCVASAFLTSSMVVVSGTGIRTRK